MSPNRRAMLESLPPTDITSYHILQKEINNGGLVDSTMDSIDYAFQNSLNNTGDFRRLIAWGNPKRLNVTESDVRFLFFFLLNYQNIFFIHRFLFHFVRFFLVFI